MSSTKSKKAFMHERGIAWAAALLLTMFLTFCLLTALLVQILTSAGLHAGAAADKRNLDEQISSIRAYIDLLAEEYGFSAENVKEAVTGDDLKNFNLNAAAWWTKLLTEGEAGSVPRWYSEKVEEAVIAAMNREGNKDDPYTVIAALSDRIDRTVFPLRETLLTTGLDFVNRRMDIPAIIRSVRKLPLLFLALSALAAGIIALAMGREAFRSLKYFGTAFAGAALAVMISGITLMVLRLNDLIAQASKGLANEISMLMRTIWLEGTAAAFLSLAAGMFCLYLYRNRGIRNRIKAGH